MRPMPQDLFSQAAPADRAGKFIQFPLFRVLVAIGFLVPVMAVNKMFKTALQPILSPSALTWVRYFEIGIFFLLFLGAFELYVKYIEKRPAWELFSGRWVADMAAGFLTAAILVGAVAAVLFFFRGPFVSGMAAMQRPALDLFFKFFMAAFLEELLFRLIVFKLSEEWLGTWIALAIQALLFGLAHGINGNASWAVSLAVVLGMGPLYTAAFIYARTLWLPLGLHWGWSFFQARIFNTANSGTTYAGLQATGSSGPAWQSRGDFSIEAFRLAIFFCLFAGVVLLGLAKANQRLVAPSWKRKG